MPLNIYACQTVHTCATAIILQSTYGPLITVHTIPKHTANCNFKLTYNCHIHKYAPQIPHMPVTSCTDIRQ